MIGFTRAHSSTPLAGCVHSVLAGTLIHSAETSVTTTLGTSGTYGTGRISPPVSGWSVSRAGPSLLTLKPIGASYPGAAAIARFPAMNAGSGRLHVPFTGHLVDNMGDNGDRVRAGQRTQEGGRLHMLRQWIQKRCAEPWSEDNERPRSCSRRADTPWANSRTATRSMGR
jgi:hypothetical protein